MFEGSLFSALARICGPRQMQLLGLPSIGNARLPHPQDVAQRADCIHPSIDVNLLQHSGPFQPAAYSLWHHPKLPMESMPWSRTACVCRSEPRDPVSLQGPESTCSEHAAQHCRAYRAVGMCNQPVLGLQNDKRKSQPIHRTCQHAATLMLG